MPVQLSAAVRDGRLDGIDAAIGASAQLRIFTGSQPANCAAADSGTKLLEIPLPATWMNPASGGDKTMAGTWINAGLAAGEAGYFRIYDTAFDTCHIQGTCGLADTEADMILDNINIAIDQTIVVLAFTLTDANS